jgi:hypothetical protein
MSKPTVARAVARDARDTREYAIPTSPALKSRAATSQKRKPSPELKIDERKTQMPC